MSNTSKERNDSMRILKKLAKISMILVVIGVFIYFGIYLYVKLSPKVVINTANSVFLYDKNEDVFFQGNEEKEWVSLDDISKYVPSIIERSLSSSVSRSESNCLRRVVLCILFL